MAVTKFWPVRKTLYKSINYAINPEKTAEREREDELKRVLDYASDKEKTERLLYVSGINCVPEIAYEQMSTVKKRYGKEDGVLAWHAYMSFSPGEVSAEQAHAIGVELGERLWGERFQVLVTTHLNTHCVHNHLIVNSVSFADGKRLRNKAWFVNRKIADEICLKHRLSVVEEPERNADPKYLIRQDKENKPTRYNLARQGMDEAIGKSTSLMELAGRLKEMGYGCNFSGRIKYWTITPKGYDKPIRLYRLGEDYTNDRIIERLRENRGREIRAAPRKKPTAKRTFSVSVPKRKPGHLKGLYLHYCYRLGILPKQRQSSAKLHYLLREELMEMDQISQEVRLMGKYHIETEDDLKTFHEDTGKKLALVHEERKKMRKELRRVENEERIPELKERIMELTKQAAEYRRELKLAEGIAERSGVMEDQLQQIRKEQEKGKVKKRYEQWR